MATGDIVKVGLKVSDLQRSVDFYSKAVGMEVLTMDGEARKAGLSFGGDISLELEESADASDPKLRGDGFLGIGVAFPNAAMVCDAAINEGGSVVVPYGDYSNAACLIPDEDELKQYPVSYGRVADPDGYMVEVVNQFRAEPFLKVMLGVLDLDEAIDFYCSKGVGMKMFRKRSNVNSRPKHASFVSYVGAGDTDEAGPFLELVYKYATDKVQQGSCCTGITLRGCDSALIESYLAEATSSSTSVATSGATASAAAVAVAKPVSVLDPNGFALHLE
jgi:catechol 2,3-dioxygenase-like lactoylglutathione lyase family enzyme